MARTKTSVSLDFIMTLRFTEVSSAFTAWKIILVSASSCVRCKLIVTSCALLDVKDITLVLSVRPPARIIPHSGCSDNHVVPCFLCNHIRNQSKILC